MFRLVGQGIEAGSDGITLSYPRRGNGLRVWTRFRNVQFQKPPQIDDTKCEIIGTRLAKALSLAQRTKDPLWDVIASSLEFFLLGHAETQELGWNSCIMLSAMAFERLLEPQQRTAQGTAQAFAKLWAPYKTRTIAQAKRVKPDHRVDYAADQQTWPLHQKWMKELYEVRSSMAHRGARSDFSQNWNEWQHMIIAAFAYPFAVKLKLAAAGLYQLKDKEVGACRALDRLLDSHWGQGWRKDPEWPTILSQSEYEPIWDRFIHQTVEEVQTGVKPRRQISSSKTKSGLGYD